MQILVPFLGEKMNLVQTADIKDIQGLISRGNSLNINVNFYQRPYRWTAKKITNLFDDYIENRESDSNEEDNEQGYFLGAVVLVNEGGDNIKNVQYQVVDGQQRFTTLFLFNYVKYLLLVKKVDEAARSNKSKDFNDGLDAMLNCYRGFIGSKNVKSISVANDNLSKAFDYANQIRDSISDDELNSWRCKVGWINNPDFSSEHYYEDCCKAMFDFISDENLRLFYQNDDFNKKLKEALSKIVFTFSSQKDTDFFRDEIELCDDNDETNIEFPYVYRAYGIFDHIKRMSEKLNTKAKNPYEKLCSYICFIDEMLEKIKLCMITTSNEDDAYKLFETLNDRSESVNDLELLKNYFFKCYSETSGDGNDVKYKNISSLDKRWRNIFFMYEDLENEIFEFMTVLFSSNKSKISNEKKRKLIKDYLSAYNVNNRYTYDKIDRDFKFMEYIKSILLLLHRIDNNTRRKTDEDSQLSLYIENDPNASVVKRALGLALNMPYPVVVGSIICDLIHNYVSNAQPEESFDSYLNDIFNNTVCKTKYSGLWKDACVMWKATILSYDFKSPKKLADALADKCYVGEIEKKRSVNSQLIQFDANILEEKNLVAEFDEWINEWKFSESDRKLKIKNLFMHLYLKYDLDEKEGKLVRVKNINRSYADKAIKQDLDHMDAFRVNRSSEEEASKYFRYNDADRTTFTNSLGNMMPLPVYVNRGKHNTPLVETLASYKKEKLDGWIFKMAQDEFKKNKEKRNKHVVPKDDFFINRKHRLIDYFKRVVINEMLDPLPEV